MPRTSTASRSSSEPRLVPVLIVGGGPVGLALAIELGSRGVACTLIEQGVTVVDGATRVPQAITPEQRARVLAHRVEWTDASTPGAVAPS